MTLTDIPDDWQHKDMAQAIQFCKKFDLAIDCGAHRGVVTRFLSQHFEQVVAIEPSELAYQITGAAQVIRACVGMAEGQCGMAHGKHNTGQRHVVEGNDYPVITLDSLNLAPDFLKIDVEGMEWHVLMGGQRTIQQHKPVIIFEENGLNKRYGISDGQVGALLASWGAQRVLVTRNGADEDWVYCWP
jgi:FkbM family methyltransferase